MNHAPPRGERVWSARQGGKGVFERLSRIARGVRASTLLRSIDETSVDSVGIHAALECPEDPTPLLARLTLIDRAAVRASEARTRLTRAAKVEQGWRGIPTGPRGSHEHIDPLPVSLPVLEACEPPKVLAGDRCPVCACPFSKPPLGFPSLSLVQARAAAQPEMTATFARCPDHESPLLPCHVAREVLWEVIQEHHGPRATPCRACIDIGSPDVLCSGPPLGQLSEGQALMAHHHPGRAAYRHIYLENAVSLPPRDHALRGIRRRQESLSPPWGGAVVHGSLGSTRPERLATRRVPCAAL